ncbi:MAG: hypothetical protein U0528_04870 [Anaerolineae bacterium]
MPIMGGDRSKLPLYQGSIGALLRIAGDYWFASTASDRRIRADIGAAETDPPSAGVITPSIRDHRIACLHAVALLFYFSQYSLR